MGLYAEEYQPQKQPDKIEKYLLCGANEPDKTEAATLQELMPGVSLVFHAVDTGQAGDIDAAEKQAIPHTLEINHCRAGRGCRMFEDGTERSLAPGELSVDLLAHQPMRTWFPDGKYSGVSIVVEISKARHTMNEMMAAVTNAKLDLQALEAALRQSGGIVLPDVERNEALFASLYLSAYHAEDRALQRLRVLEITAHICHAVEAIQHEGAAPKQDRKMLEVRDYLVQNCTRHITLRQLAERFAISETTLKQRFAAAFGTTVDRYLRHYRLSAAEALLLSTDRTIADVARAVGFRSSSVFSVRFARQFGQPPGQYRKTSQKMREISKKIPTKA